jgi:hypothetical protein
MRFGTLRCLLVGASVCALAQQNQNLNVGHPQEISVQHHATAEELRDRVAKAHFQKDIQELTDLCNSVPHDMDALKQGVLSKDVIDRLKRMEKLSKQVREQLARD